MSSMTVYTEKLRTIYLILCRPDFVVPCLNFSRQMRTVGLLIWSLRCSWRL